MTKVNPKPQRTSKSYKTSETFDKYYAGLNPEQKAAVDTIEGPVLVIAGPGTGKTQVLTMRIANILLKTDTPSSAILALTFTESGVRAMRERLLTIIGPEAYYVNISTFHSFCSDIIKANPDKFTISADLEPLSDLERIQIFREIIDENSFKTIKPFGSKYYYVKALIKAIQDLKREGIIPPDFEKFALSMDESEKDREKLLEVAKVYDFYQHKLITKERYDFEDMINLVTIMLQQDPDLLRDYQERFLYFLIDEYQDTNSPQNNVLSLLASFWGANANIFAVGDDAQSIYRFQGASLENILFYTQTFPTAKVITLRSNYRSQEIIIKASEDVIENNEVQVTKFIPDLLKFQKSQASYEQLPVQVAHFSSGITESFFVAEKIKELTEAGVDPKEIAIIYRNNTDSKDFADMLSRSGINYNLVGGENVLEDIDINKFLKLLDVIWKVRSKSEDIDLFTVLNYEFFNFDYLDTLKLARFASERKINFVEAICHEDFEIASRIKTPQRFKDFMIRLQEWGALDCNVSFIEFFEKVLQESGFLNWVLESKNNIEKLNRVNSLFSEVKRLNTADHDLNLERFIENIAILRESHIPIYEEELNLRNNAVLLTTAHRSKGLEFEYVFIVRCTDGKWGNKKSRELIKLPEGLLSTSLSVSLQSSSQDSLAQKQQQEKQALVKEKNEDERRLFYVAMTRAKKELFITYADSYLTDTSRREAVPSMFISEIGDDKKVAIDISPYENSVKDVLSEILKPVADRQVSMEESEFLQDLLKNFSMSVTALNTYLDCPYKFKLHNLLRTPRAKDKYLALGTAVHGALEYFFRAYRNDDKLPSKDYLINTFNHFLKDEILTKADYTDSKEKGELLLSKYYDFYKDTFEKPIYTEKNFGYGSGKVYLDDIPLVGKVDKVELLDAKEKTVRVIDFKTGKTRTRNEIGGKTQSSDGSYKRQLVFYKLLADMDRSFKYTVEETQLDFVEANKTGKFVRESFNISIEEVEELKKLIRDVMVKIRNLEFPVTSDYTSCQMCEYKSHCWPDGIPQNSQNAQAPATPEQLGLL